MAICRAGRGGRGGSQLSSYACRLAPAPHRPAGTTQSMRCCHVRACAGSTGSNDHWLSDNLVAAPLPLGPVVRSPPEKVNRPAQLEDGFRPGLRVLQTGSARPAADHACVLQSVAAVCRRLSAVCTGCRRRGPARSTARRAHIRLPQKPDGHNDVTAGSPFTMVVSKFAAAAGPAPSSANTNARANILPASDQQALKGSSFETRFWFGQFASSASEPRVG